MNREECSLEPSSSLTAPPANEPDPASMPDEVSKPKPVLIASTPVPEAADYSWKTEAIAVRNNAAIADLFVTRKWHRAYANALLETDDSKLPALIAVAGEAILARYVELAVSPVPTDEILDLQHAVVALSQLSEHSPAGGVGLPNIC